MNPSAVPDDWRTLIDATLAELDTLVDDSVREIRAQLPVYRSLDETELRQSLALSFIRVLQAARAHDVRTHDSDLADLAAGARHRAENGVPADEMLLAWRIGFQVAVRHARLIGEQRAVPPEQVLELLQSLIAWADRGMVVVATAHHRADVELARADQDLRGGFVRAVLLGSLPPGGLAEQSRHHGVDDARRYVAIRADVPPGMTPLEVQRLVGFAEGEITTSLDGDVIGFLPGSTSRTIGARATSVAIGIGPERTLEHLSESFAQATRALETARAFELSGPHGFEELGLLPAVLTDTVVGDHLRTRYVAPLSPEIAASVRTWLAAGAHVERAAAQLTVHPNTLRYRLSRFEELTGANLKEPTAQFEAWWALHYDLVANSKELRDRPRSSGRRY